jgi:putative membrane protein
MSNEQKDRTLFVSTILIIVVHLAGVIGLFSAYQNLFLQLTPINLLISSFLLFLNHKQFNTAFYTFLGISFLLGFFIEMIGVKTGFIFGQYHYGDTLGLKIGNVPIIIGLNWLMLVYCLGIICNQLKITIFFKSILGSIMLVALDLLIEPVAVKFNFWSWESKYIPVQNYIAWFFVSFILLFFFNILPFDKNNKLAKALFIVQLVFFALLNIF